MCNLSENFSKILIYVVYVMNAMMYTRKSIVFQCCLLCKWQLPSAVKCQENKLYRFVSFHQLILLNVLKKFSVNVTQVDFVNDFTRLDTCTFRRKLSFTS